MFYNGLNVSDIQLINQSTIAVHCWTQASQNCIRILIPWFSASITFNQSTQRFAVLCWTQDSQNCVLTPSRWSSTSDTSQQPFLGHRSIGLKGVLHCVCRFNSPLKNSLASPAIALTTNMARPLLLPLANSTSYIDHSSSCKDNLIIDFILQRNSEYISLSHITKNKQVLLAVQYSDKLQCQRR